MSQPVVEVYVSPTCPACHQVKQFLEDNGVEYSEFDVSKDEEALKRIVKETDQMVVPIIKVGEDQYVIGFDRGELEKLLDL